jgi:CBS domain-containing protein
MMTMNASGEATTSIADLVLEPLITVESDQSLWDAWQLMFLSGLRHLAVVDDNRRCVGVLTDRSILTDLPLTEAHLASRRVREVMASPGMLTMADTPRCAAESMVRFAVEAIPLVEETGRLRGLVTAGDLVRYWANT